MATNRVNHAACGMVDTAIQEAKDGNTQDQVKDADELALAGGVHVAPVKCEITLRFQHCRSGHAIKIG